uniref:Cullin-9-like n=1 Tax=Sinocyclocheilus grahami TaxID=75366 RepID=A0A672L9C9_SINGR
MSSATMVGERRNGNLLVQLGPKLQAFPEELIRQRRTHDNQTEYLIRWSLSSGGGGSSGSTSGESKSESILMWMSTEDVYANCPTLLGKRKADSQRPLLEEEERPSGQFPADVTFDEGELLDMKDDVKNLVRRARKQMAKNSDFRISITHTIHVLSAYASIGSLVGVFKETGALDLLMELLCNKERQTRRSAGKMLRALASHDAGSRAYVLLSLSQQDGIEQHMDFENRYTLLELFAETTSSEEHGISFEGIHLPQIPGKLLFSLVKRYLCVTSLMDKLNTAGVEPTSERQDVGPSSSTAAYQSEHTRVQREFEFTMAMANLISELVRVMGWDRNRQPPHTSSSASRGVEEINNEIQKHPVRSIFQPRFSASSPIMAATAIAAAVTPPKKKKTTNGFKTRSDFTSRSAYVEFVQDNLKSGMVVRMLEDYEEVSAGDEGEFRYSNDGSPPVQVYWNSLSRTYWVHWHMIEILGNGSGGQAEKETQEKASSLTETLKLTTVSQTFFSKPPGGLYTLPYLMEGSQDDAGTLSRAEWWEVLFFIKKLEPKQQQEINNILRQSLDEPVLTISPALFTQGRIESQDEHDFKDTELKMLVVSLKEMPATKEVILTLEQLLCDDASQLEEERSEVTRSRDTFQDLIRLMDQHRADRAAQLSILRILNKFLDNYQEDLLPWHESIEPCLSSMTAFVSDREVVQQFIRFLYRLASLNKDYAVVMCRLGTKEALLKALDKHSTSLLMVTELRDLINDCEKYASLYKKMTTSVLAGCIQMVLGQIEEHRRSHQPINIPFFDVFLRNLCQGSSVELKEDKCWEKVEVSSNHHRANKLTDKNPKTYWESNGCTGSHFINIYMHKGVIIRYLTVLVASEDSSYMPARIVVLGGDDPTNINTELNTVNVAPSASHVVLLENMSRFWPIIQIRVKRCQQGGIDTRVHGFEVLGPKPTFWPVFKEQLCCRTYLFHTTKAHTWCQEILEDKNQLLQLFSKLNSALKHEQMFADRFLPDAEAAEALGRTCWEALITPIVQSITISETSTLSPLSWLMNDYLENADSSKRCKSSASVFNSRVRRLTHLLVHVDTSTVDTEELKPPIKSSELSSSSSSSKPKVKNTSSIAGIALCWQGVIQRQVKSFLDSTCSLPDFVERYRGLFLQLKNAMEELFGQHTAFVLALRQGFSAALLQLSILTAMHVSERFAQYIDKMIQESGVDSGNVDTLNQLQQFLEPMLFLSGLELANTFEHFYRYYMGDRLLGQGKMWLESAVVEQIGTCFPNRFPQQMLTNLSESEELQQEFHLYRLQQLDTNLENFEEDVSEPEEESDVKVLVLSPRCWVVSAPCYLEDPSKHFTAQLCNYLAEFTEFYANSQRMYGLTHSKPRRLQWTWLGHAELQYGSCTLYVSTLQMYILLQFNKHEDVSVEMLQQATGLSPAMLSHALKPLTAEKGILTHTDSNRHGYHFLLPTQTYLNVDEDAALTLERKRNYIYCLIVQIMKNEKEMHIDNLVFKVLDRCQKQEASRTRGSVRFSCSTTDVLSCIMHVINKGYICRNEESPHIVEFLMEDPSTPRKGQAQFSFKMDVKKSSISASAHPEDGVLEAVLFSMGRTMTQEEVRQLMQRTVQQVAGTLSLDLDRAEHLLMHCKWNVDLLIQRYTDDPDALVLAAGLKIRNPQPAPGALAQCPVCLSQSKESDPPPMLCCMHYCCRSCWQEYLTARIEQNLVMNCDCPITDCRAQPTSKFFHNILTDKDTIAKYDSALLRGFVECCSNLTWCTNPQGCDQVLCKENIGSMGTCSKCCWSSCFSCNFPEAHYPASCSHMSQWMDDGGFYEGMSMEAQSKHLAKLISKRCPSCQAQIEKNEGCLHMTCAKCNHGFCWRCLKPWKPTHKDYYNCSAMVSKAARQEKKFQDYNERCTFHNQAKDFAINLENKVFSINEALQMKSLTFVIDACKILAQARKVLAYSCVYSYYNQDTEKMDVMEQQTEALDLHTNALQILLEETLLQCTDLASCIRLLKPEHLNTGLELIRRIQERLVAILQHSTQDFRVGYQSKTGPDQETAQASNLANHADANKGSKSDEAEEDDEYDDEYVPEWHEDYDEEDIDDDDFFSDDDESENLERDFSPFD